MTQPAVIFRKRLETKQDKPVYWTGIVGNGAGVVNVPDRDGFVYVRIDGASVPEEVYNDSIPVANDLAVILGIDPSQPNVKRIWRARYVQGLTGGTLPTQITASRFRWMAPGGGQDPLFVEKRQIMPLRPGPYSGMVVQVARDFVKTASGYVQVNNTTADLTSYRPTTAGYAAWVLLTLNSTGALVLTKGTEVGTTALTMADIPTAPGGSVMELAAVRVYAGQTAVQEARSNTDIIDLRYTSNASGGGDYDPSLIVTKFAAGSYRTYVANGTGLSSALSEANTGDQITLPQGNFGAYDTEYTLPQGAELIGSGMSFYAGGSNICGKLNLSADSIVRDVSVINIAQSSTALVALDAGGITCQLHNVFCYAENVDVGTATAMKSGQNCAHINSIFYAWASATSQNPFDSTATYPGGNAHGSWVEKQYLDQFCYDDDIFDLTSDRAGWDTTNNPDQHARDIYTHTMVHHLPTPGTAGRVVMDNGTNWVDVQTYSTANVSVPPTSAELVSAFGTVPKGFRGTVNDAGGSTTVWSIAYDGTNWYYGTMGKAS